MNSVTSALVALALTAVAPPSAFGGDGQAPSPKPSAASRSDWRLGAQGFGVAAIEFPVAKDAFADSSLDTKLFEAGGGAQVTNIWRSLFVQGAFSRWSDTGERVFIDSRGTKFGLGIPLTVRASYIDISAGWRFEQLRGSRSAQRVVPYVAGGAGVLRYEETSPFAQSGENLDEQFTTYHALLGAEYWFLNWVAVAGDVKYRLVRDVLGTAGVSAVRDEDRFDGTSLTVRVLIGPGGPLGRRPRRGTKPLPPKTEAAPRAPAAPRGPSGLPPGPQQLRALINAPAPVYIAADERRAPLRTLPQGEVVQVRRELGDWLVIEFADPQWGLRVGYVRRKFVTFSTE